MNTRSVTTAPRPLSHRMREKQDRRRRILTAAEAVFSVRGFHEASVNEIARQAGMAAGTVYLYFEDKADLYGQLIVDKMTEVVALMDRSLNSDPSAARSIRTAVHAQFAFHDANRRFFEIFLHQDQVQTSPLHESHWREMEQLKRHNLTLIEKCIARGQADGELKPGPPRLFAVAFLGITLQMVRQWIREKGNSPLADSADFAADCFLHGSALSPS